MKKEEFDKTHYVNGRDISIRLYKELDEQGFVKEGSPNEIYYHRHDKENKDE